MRAIDPLDPAVRRGRACLHDQRDPRALRHPHGRAHEGQQVRLDAERDEAAAPDVVLVLELAHGAHDVRRARVVLAEDAPGVRALGAGYRLVVTRHERGADAVAVLASSIRATSDDCACIKEAVRPIELGRAER